MFNFCFDLHWISFLLTETLQDNQGRPYITVTGKHFRRTVGIRSSDIPEWNNRLFWCKRRAVTLVTTTSSHLIVSWGLAVHSSWSIQTGKDFHWIPIPSVCISRAVCKQYRQVSFIWQARSQRDGLLSWSLPIKYFHKIPLTFTRPSLAWVCKHIRLVHSGNLVKIV